MTDSPAAAATGRPESGRPDEAQNMELFREYVADPTRQRRNVLVERYLGLAQHLAKRYAFRGVPVDDLRQVAIVGLVKAVERFDPDRGFAFSTFAGRTIEGEVKRHFRDATWVLRVPRHTQEMHLAVRRASDELRQMLGRAPTPADVAKHLEIGVDEVVDALTASAAYQPNSLDTPAPHDDQQSNDRSAHLATRDPSIEATSERVAIRQLLAQLPERERQIVWLRFFGQRTQSEIAEEVGMSQMHVSRLLKRSLELMRARSGIGVESLHVDG